MLNLREKVMNNEELKSNLLSSRHWLRLVFMLLFAALLQIAGIVMWVLVILQFLFSLISGQDNRNLRELGSSLSRYIYQTLKFLSYNSEEKPFPFSDWSSSAETNTAEANTAGESVIVTETSVSPTVIVTPTGDTSNKEDPRTQDKG